MARASREWVTFADPKEDGRTWQLDVTFLLSSWQCIFGAGCQGVLDEKAPELAMGCCSYGAYFADRDDRDHVAQIAEELTDDEWQFAENGRANGIYKKMERDAEGTREWHTRLVQDACIFLNRVDFPAGPGCALHLHAMNTGRHHSEVKPEICWQLPLRRIDEDQEDGTVISTLTEFGRAGWGEGGDDFAWWCTEAPGGVHRERAGVPLARRRAAQDARQEAPPPGRRVPRRPARVIRLPARRPSLRGAGADHPESGDEMTI